MFFGLKQAGLPAVYIEARHAEAAMVAMNRNKNDRNDARSIAHLIRSGWFKAVQVKSVASQELRSLLVAREFFVNKLRDHENEIRGLLRPFGLHRLGDPEIRLDVRRDGAFRRRRSRSADIVAVGYASCLVLERSHFEDLARQRPGILMQICRVLAGRLRAANRSLHDLQTGPSTKSGLLAPGSTAQYAAACSDFLVFRNVRLQREAAYSVCNCNVRYW